MRSVVLVCVVAAVLIGLWGDAKADDLRWVRGAGEKKFVLATDVAERLGMELKIVDPDRLLVFCHTDDRALCVPVRVEAGGVVAKDAQLYVDCRIVAKALNLKFEVQADELRLTTHLASEARAERDEYATVVDDWPPGRGFRTGQTLPDLPLVDLQGREVRFSEFLGRRYILYCWASW